MTNLELARDLYYSFFYSVGGVSPISGSKLSEWDELSQIARDGWECAARYVFSCVADGTFDEYRRIHGKENQSLPTAGSAS